MVISFVSLFSDGYTISEKKSSVTEFSLFYMFILIFETFQN